MSQQFISEGYLAIYGMEEDIKKIIKKNDTDDDIMVSFKNVLSKGAFIPDGYFKWDIPFDTNDNWVSYALKKLHSDSKNLEIRFLLDANLGNHSYDIENSLHLDITSKNRWHEPKFMLGFSDLKI